jgi:hypothetical protein
VQCTPHMSLRERAATNMRMLSEAHQADIALQARKKVSPRWPTPPCCAVLLGCCIGCRPAAVVNPAARRQAMNMHTRGIAGMPQRLPLSLPRTQLRRWGCSRYGGASLVQPLMPWGAVP